MKKSHKAKITRSELRKNFNDRLANSRHIPNIFGLFPYHEPKKVERAFNLILAKRFQFIYQDISEQSGWHSGTLETLAGEIKHETGISVPIKLLHRIGRKAKLNGVKPKQYRHSTNMI